MNLHCCGWFSVLSEALNMFFTPAMLLVCGVTLSAGIGIHRILRPSRFLHTLLDIPENSRTTPFKAVTMALAGTLGVGNITGVSAAILQGGIGAVFWMWVGALVSMAVKYGEVALAVVYRKQTEDGRWYGGMMYVIREGLGKKIPVEAAWGLGGLFALLCLGNALVTGTIVQSNAAAVVMAPVPVWVSGVFLALITTAAVLYGVEKVGNITLRLVPGMTVFFSVLSLWIILGNLHMIPSILREIAAEAFSLQAFGGGVAGMGIRELFASAGKTGLGQAVRYGITRGIFSNEAGCGTSPTAHAAADTKSPFHQGCYGILEVFCDTIVLCTMTALVLCIGDRRYGIFSMGDANLTLRAYQMFGGDAVYVCMACMVGVFAYATILAQMYYGTTALGYFTGKKTAGRIYTAVTVLCIFVGAVMDAGIMWKLADGLIGLMTCMNTAVLFCLRKEIYDTLPWKKEK